MFFKKKYFIFVKNHKFNLLLTKFKSLVRNQILYKFLNKNYYIMPGNEDLNLRLLIEETIGPNISLPRGVNLFFNKTTLFSKNFIKLPSHLCTSFLVLTKIPLTLLLTFNQFSGLVRFTDTLTKLPQ